MNTLIAFATEDNRHRVDSFLRHYRDEAERLLESGRRHGLATRLWTADELRQTAWYTAHRALLDKPQMGGSAWKPYIILETLTQTDPGDVVIYADSDMAFLVEPIDLLLGAEANGLWLMNHRPFNDYPLKNWAHLDCLRLMGCDGEPYWSYPQVHANLHAWANGWLAHEVLREWLSWCEVEQVVWWDRATQTGHDGFREHRNEQAILSLIACRRNLPVNEQPAGLFTENWIGTSC